MPRRIESFFIAGAAGKIEALLEEPEDMAPLEAALVCHPHPQHGGTMHNKVVYRLARGLRKSGCVVLRFNYRGVNLSEGAYDHGYGETDDGRAALHELQRRYSNLPLLAGGFSFGSRIVARLANDHPAIGRLILVGFPLNYPDREHVYQVGIPKYFVQSTNDEFGPHPKFTAFYESVPEPKRLDWIEASDHFFKDGLDAYERVIEQIGLLRQQPAPSEGMLLTTDMPPV
ncbi:MAG: alpha/beta hydrolase [Bryobacteraceae bacterium]